MKAIIMAGGEGTRLRPLTCDRPKPMMPLCGRPMMEYILDLLSRHGVDCAAVTLQYLAPEIEHYFIDRYGNRYRGIHLHFITEEKAMGTAGSVRGAAAVPLDEGFIGEEDFIVISGDCLCDFDLSAAVRSHRERKADATIVVKRVEDPREYGLVDCTEDGRVIGFVEKPSYAQAVTDLANTGVYILSPNVLKLIDEKIPSDFAKDVFPAMLAEGMRVCAHEEKGYWCDIGDLHTYLRCQQDMIAGRVRCEMKARYAATGILCAGELPRGSYTLIPPVYIGRNVTIGEGSVVENSILSDASCIGPFCEVHGSVLLPSTFLAEDAYLQGAILGTGSSVKQGGRIADGAVIGTGSVVGQRAQVLEEVKVWPRKSVQDDAVLHTNLRSGFGMRIAFDENGLCGETGIELTPEYCAKIGAAIGSTHLGKRIGVASGTNPAATALRRSLIAGILSTGTPVWDYKGCFESEFAFCTTFCGLDLGVYLHAGIDSRVQVTTAGGLPAPRSLERQIEGYLSRGDFVRCRWDRFGEVVDMSGLHLLYEQELVRFSGAPLSGLSVSVRSSERAAGRVLERALERLGCETKGELCLHLGNSGRTLAATDPVKGYLSPEKLLALCCLLEARAGHDLAVPFDAPRVLDEIAAKENVQLFRYLYCPADGSDRIARELAAKQLWVRGRRYDGSTTTFCNGRYGL